PVHGSAPDIAGKDAANPLATLLSFAMLLRYSFALGDEADLLEQAVKRVLADGVRTADIATPGTRTVSTTAMGDAVIGALDRLSWGIVALIGCTVTTALARAVAPVAVVSVALTLVWTGGFALLRAAGKEGAGVGFVLGAMFVILNGLPSQSSVPTLTIQSAAGGVAGLAIMILAGLGRGSSRGEPAPTLAGIVRGVGVALRHDATLRTHALRVGLATAFAAALASVLGSSFGYWIPLTVIAVLQPDSHSSRVR